MYLKKAIGTLALAGTLLSAVMMVAPPAALAAYITQVFGIVADGLVTEVHGNEFSILTSGGDVVDINVSTRTQVLGGSIHPGVQVRVVAKERGTVLVATYVKIQEFAGTYGVPGEQVVVIESDVVGGGDDTLVVEHNNGTVEFQITPSTRFVGGSFASLDVGDRVFVTGRDTGEEFVATLVKVK